MLSRSFRSLKPHNPTLKPNSIPKPPNPSKSSNLTPVSSSSKSPSSTSSRTRSKSERLWSVYLILSTNSPIKTYVGVTNNFSRRLKQHNGELKGGAKASRAGRPWVCACIVRGFHDKSEACAFESNWKNVSRKLPRKRKTEDDPGKELGEAGSLLLLQHRQAALNRVKTSIVCDHLDFDWQLNPF